MKKKALALLFLLLSSMLIQAQTQGDLSVTTNTSDANGNYAPKNIVAIWIEDDAGNFVKTLLAYAATRITHLNKWQATTNAAGSQFNIVDAITGATRPNHDVRNCSWNATNFNGELVMDGTYYVWMELTDKNGTGNFSSFPFTKNATAEMLSPTDVPSFSAIELNWVPQNTSGISEIDNSVEFVAYPNPSSGVYTIKMKETGEVAIRNILGKLVYTARTTIIDISDQPNGIYFLTVTINDRTATTKLIKK